MITRNSASLDTLTRSVLQFKGLQVDTSSIAKGEKGLELDMKSSMRPVAAFEANYTNFAGYLSISMRTLQNCRMKQPSKMKKNGC